jgi:hypothetical protein
MNSSNLPQRTFVKSEETKRKFDAFDANPFEYDVPTSNYATVRKQQQTSSSSSVIVKRTKTDATVTLVS